MNAVTDEKVVLREDEMVRALTRIAHEIAERNIDELPVLVGIHRRGAYLARRMQLLLSDLLGQPVHLGDVDISFYRDDVALREGAPVVHATHLDFAIDGRTVIVMDDVLYTGRTVRAAIEALFDYGRPARVQLAVLVDRGHRELPIRPDYIGKNLPTARGERRQRAPARVRRGGRGRDRTRDGDGDGDHDRGGPDMRHLLSIEDLDREAIERIVEHAARFAQVSDRTIKKVPTLRGRLVINLFYEASTRTRSSFELAAKRLSADVLNFTSSGSSVEKGESLRDTVATLSAYGPDALVVRSPHVGAAALVAGWTPAAVVNAGDGTHEHPTQALLDVYTLTRTLGALDGRSIWIVGDVLHSRVARSNIAAFTRMGAHVTVCGPPTLIPPGIETLGCEVRYDLTEMRSADVVYALRMQNERMRTSYVPSLREYVARYQINARRLGRRQLLMHPGPVNRGVELSSDVMDSSRALITEQVRSGVVVRMAVLYELLAGSRPWAPAHGERAKPRSRGSGSGSGSGTGGEQPLRPGPGKVLA